MVEHSQTGASAPDETVVVPRKGKMEQASTLRQCALTRQKRPTNELIRFVKGPGDEIYPDLTCRLPGRGVWITADRKSIDKAVSTRAFARSLKERAAASSQLPETIDNLLAERAAQSLALANKAGLVTSGFDKVFGLIEQGKAVFLLHGQDAAAGGCDRLNRKFQASRSWPAATTAAFAGLTIGQLSLAIGRSNVVHAALKEGGAARRFMREAQRLADYRNGLDQPRPHGRTTEDQR